MKPIAAASCLVASLLVPALAAGLEKPEFEKQMAALEARNFGAVERFLAEKKVELAHDPDYYVVLLNCVYAKGTRSGIVMEQGEARQGDLQLSDPKTGDAVGFIRERRDYDVDLIVQGIRRTQKALEHFPSRLDIHMGIVSIAQEMGRWDVVGEQVVAALEVSRKIGNAWTWGPIGSMEGDPQNFLIQNVLARTEAMFRAESPAADRELQRVSAALVRLYPKLIYGYANLGAYHLARNELDQAEKYLRQALAIDPADEVVLGNLKVLEKMRKAR